MSQLKKNNVVYASLNGPLSRFIPTRDHSEEIEHFYIGKGEKRSLSWASAAERDIASLIILFFVDKQKMGYNFDD